MDSMNRVASSAKYSDTPTPDPNKHVHKAIFSATFLRLFFAPSAAKSFLA